MRLFVFLLMISLTNSLTYSQQKENKIGTGVNDVSSYFITLNGGANIYVGDHDKWGIFDERIGGAYELSIGKWFRPTWGTRLQFAGGKAKGASLEVGDFTSETVNKWGRYTESFNTMNVHADFLVNISRWWGNENTGRNYELVPFVGLAYASASNGSIRNSQPAFTAGAINMFRLSDKWGANVEIRGLLLNDPFDGVEGRNPMEGMASLTAGITYRFGKSPVKSKTAATVVELTTEEVDEETVEADKDVLIAEMQKELDNKNRLIKQLYKDLDAERAKLKDSAYIAMARAEENAEKTSLAIFFPIGATLLDGQDIINLGYLADKIKASSNKFTITGYADAGTGSANRNKYLSDKRAQNVYKVLVDKYKVNPEQLEIVAKGGVDNMFESEEFNRVVLIENK